MYLSDRDLNHAMDIGDLIVEPRPGTDRIDTSGIDLRLAAVSTALVWDAAAHAAAMEVSGHPPRLGLGRTFNYKAFAGQYTKPVPAERDRPAGAKVYRDGEAVVVEPGGFFLWQTLEEVGTPSTKARLICFIDGKSTRARTGLLVHLTAPTIHAGWVGKVTLELANLGPFTLSLREGDVVAQIVVATLSSPPLNEKRAKGIDLNQQDPTGVAPG